MSQEESTTGFDDEQLQFSKWSQAPSTEDGSPLDMPFWFYVNGIRKVDTKEMSAEVDFGIAWRWIDRRMIKWKEKLPPLLWGPEMEFWNASGGTLNTKQVAFSLRDPSTGLMQRNDRYVALVKCDPDASFKFFPYDSMVVECKLSTAGNWRSYDGTESNQEDNRLVYALRARPISEEEPLFHLWSFSGSLAEWTMSGISHTVERELLPGADGDASLDSHIQRVCVKMHLERKALHYVVKMMIPLWLTGVMTCGALSIPFNDIADRITHVITGFLAATALQFVINNEVPKNNTLTVIDWLVLFTIVWLFALMLLCIITFHDVEEQSNIGIEIGIPVAYTLIFWIITFAPYVHRRIGTLDIENFLPLHGNIGLKIS